MATTVAIPMTRLVVRRCFWTRVPTLVGRIVTARPLSQSGIGFRSLQEEIDTTPGGKVVFHVFAALSEFERRG